MELGRGQLAYIGCVGVVHATPLQTRLCRVGLPPYLVLTFGAHSLDAVSHTYVQRRGRAGCAEIGDAHDLIGNAIRFCHALMQANRYEGIRKVINVSGDGCQRYV